MSPSGRQDLAQALLDAMAEAVYVVDRNRRITYWNRAAEVVTGYHAADVLGRRCRDGILNHVDDEGEPLCGSRCPLLFTMKDGLPREARVYLHHREGHRVPVLVKAAPLRDDAGTITGAVEVFHDDSDFRSLSAALEDSRAMSLTDPLTGLGNRRHLDHALAERLADRRRSHRTLALLFADLDRFKSVNDEHGHRVGDQVLRQVSATLRRCIRPGDTVGRWGGEEFVVVAEVAAAAEAMALAERLRRLVASGWVDLPGPGREAVRVTVSIGVATACDRDTPLTLASRADAAMLTAKRRGRDAVAFAACDDDCCRDVPTPQPSGGKPGAPLG